MQASCRTPRATFAFAAPKDGGPFLVSTRSEEEIVASAPRWAKVAGATGVVAGVAGVGRVVAGVLA